MQMFELEASIVKKLYELTGENETEAWFHVSVYYPESHSAKSAESYTIETDLQYANDCERFFSDTTLIDKNEFESMAPEQIALVVFEDIRKHQQMYLTEEEMLVLKLEHIEADIKRMQDEIEWKRKEAEEIKRKLKSEHFK